MCDHEQLAGHDYAECMSRACILRAANGVLALHFPEMFHAPAGAGSEPIPVTAARTIILALFVNCDCECFIVLLYSDEILGALN